MTSVWQGARALCAVVDKDGYKSWPLVSVRPGRLKLHGTHGCKLTVAAAAAVDPIRPREMEQQNKLKIGIVGFGSFGQFLAKRIVEQGHHVLAQSRSDYSGLSREMGVSFFRDLDEFCQEQPDVVLLATSILSTESVLRSLPLERLGRNALFVDVLSVKEFPKTLFQQVLPTEFDLLCTHPMFGPESGKESWKSLPFVYEKVRIGNGDRCQTFLDIFELEGCRMIEMSCEEHDRFAASSQFITHTVGRMLGKLQLESTPINTKGYETLLNLVQNTAGDSFDLYYGLFMYNKSATEELERLELAFDALKKQLFSKLHNILRKQLFDVKTAAITNTSVEFSVSAAATIYTAEKALDKPIQEVPKLKDSPLIRAVAEILDKPLQELKPAPDMCADETEPPASQNSERS